jgi:hypothetical protein
MAPSLFLFLDVRPNAFIGDGQRIKSEHTALRLFFFQFSSLAKRLAKIAIYGYSPSRAISRKGI